MGSDHDHEGRQRSHEEGNNLAFTTFNDGETVKDYALRLSDMVAHLTTLDEEVKDDEIVAKMLRSLLPHFKQITIAIKTLLDVSMLQI
jgi:hypothetical protein